MELLALSDIWQYGQYVLAAIVPVAFVLLIIAGIVASVGDSIHRGKLRQERPEQEQKIPAIAQQNGWDYVPRDDRWLSVIDVFEKGQDPQSVETAKKNQLKGKGASGRALYSTRFEVNPTSVVEHVITTNVQGRQCVVFQHRANEGQPRKTKQDTWETRWEEDPDKANYGVTVAMQLPKPTPFVCIARRWRGAVSSFVGDDTTLEHHGFNRKYFVFMEHMRFGYDIVNQSTISWILETQPPKGVFLTVADGWCFISRQDILRAEEVQQHVDELSQFVSLIPDHVWSVDYSN